MIVLRARRGAACGPGIADPAGRHHRAVAARARLRRGRAGSGSARRIRFTIEAADEAAARAEVERPVPPVPHQPGHRGRRRSSSSAVAGAAADGRPGRRRPLPRVELRARRASRPSRSLGGEAELLWHGDATLERRRRRRRARRVRPRRLPAARGHRPVLAGDGGGGRASPPPVARWSASATASRCSPRPGCCPVRCRRTPGLKFLCSHGRRCGSSRTDSVLTAGPRSGTVLRIPINHFEGNYTCDAETLAPAPGRGPGRAPLRRQPQRLDRRHRRRLQRRAATWSG